MSYRRDIDGLRGLAVIAVVFYHAKIYGFAGGFTGVDVFLVISGYLITGLILHEIAAGTFCLAQFYQRRVRRILPALTVVLFVCTAAAPVFLLPPDLKRFSDSEIATLLFSSNVYFWRTWDYFETSRTVPLLHTWSLGIEEQFYILYPAFLALLLKAGQRRSAIILAVMLVISLVLGAAGTFFKPAAAFYLLPSRGWELLLGALLNWIPAPRFRGVLESITVCGLALIAAAILAYSPATAYPGLAALAPCAGTALVIYGNSNNTFASRLLSSTALVQTGLISYSLYLIHWPLLVFARAALGRAPSPVITTLILAASFGAAIVSYKFVEQPFRARNRIGVRRLFSSIGISAGALASVALGMHFTGGWPSRFSPDAVAMADYVNYEATPEGAAAFRTGTCFSADPSAIFPPNSTGIKWEDCFTPDAGKKNIVLWGDSHAAHYAPGLQLLSARAGGHLMQATMSSCPPLLGYWSASIPHCQSLNDTVWSKLQHMHPDAVILSAHWLALESADRFRLLHQTIQALTSRNIPVVLIGPSVEFSESLPEVIARQIAHHVKPGRLAATEAAVLLDHQMKSEFAPIPGVTYVSTLDAVCPHGECPTYASAGVPLTFDDNHLTAEGSAMITQQALARPLALLLGERD